MAEYPIGSFEWTACQAWMHYLSGGSRTAMEAAEEFTQSLAEHDAEVERAAAARALEEAAEIFDAKNFSKMPDGSEGHYQQAHVRNDTQRRLRARAVEIREAE